MIQFMSHEYINTYHLPWVTKMCFLEVSIGSSQKAPFPHGLHPIEALVDNLGGLTIITSYSQSFFCVQKMCLKMVKRFFCFSVLYKLFLWIKRGPSGFK